jgi:protein-S-isoprenylcysteine O-methyltransferase Ste14
VIAVLGDAEVIRLGRSPVLIATSASSPSPCLAAFWWLASLTSVPIDTGHWFPVYDTTRAAYSLAFTLGVLTYVYADRCAMTNRGAAVAAGALVGAFATDSYATEQIEA